MGQDNVVHTVVTVAMAALWITLGLKMLKKLNAEDSSDTDAFQYSAGNKQDKPAAGGLWSIFPFTLFKKKTFNCRGRPGDPNRGARQMAGPSQPAPAPASTDLTGQYDKARVRVYRDSKWEDVGKDAKVMLVGDEGLPEDKVMWQLRIQSRGQQCVLQQEVSNDMQLREAGSDRTVKLRSTAGQFWELQFPSSAALQAFVADFHLKLKLNHLLQLTSTSS